ncbi:MAG: hypothetical protein FWE35_27655 [Streptosporangiales bacterium]|nr:hypothetical protein [Streptosporangiales bacterium]
MNPQSVTPNGPSLATFADNWIGTDIHGLQGTAQDLSQRVQRVRDLTRCLSAIARDITAAAPDPWQGTAAASFTASWERQFEILTALARCVTGVARVLEGLAIRLSRIEISLEEQAFDARRHGVRVGPDGAVESCSGPRALEYAARYDQARKRALAEADALRDAAAARLRRLYAPAGLRTGRAGPSNAARAGRRPGE